MNTTDSRILFAPLLFVALITLISCTKLKATPATFEPGILQDIPYSNHHKNKLDIYLPPAANNAPVIFMVHGGAWRFGDKAAKAVVKNKMRRWVGKGFIFISVNYRLLPEANPLEQVADVAKALAFSQKKAADWGGDSNKFILMGHSAGAHLVSVLAASPALAFDHGAAPWLGTVSIDSAALNLVAVMERKHFRFYDKVFGDDVAFWKALSPFHLLQKPQAPFLAICSTQRKDDACPQAAQFVAKAHSLNMQANVLKVDLSHREANANLGKESIYTRAVESFLITLDRSIKQALINQ